MIAWEGAKNVAGASLYLILNYQVKWKVERGSTQNCECVPLFFLCYKEYPQFNLHVWACGDWCGSHFMVPIAWVPYHIHINTVDNRGRGLYIIVSVIVKALSQL